MVILCNVECVDMNLILFMEVPVAPVDSAKDAIRQFVQDADMEIHYPTKRSLIISQNFKLN